MAVMDEFKKERQEALANASFKEKLSYYIYYYKWYVIIALLAVIAIVYTVHAVLDQKESALYVSLLNTVELDGASEYNQSFVDASGIDTQAQDITFDSNLYIDINSMDETTMASSQKLMAYLAAGELDVLLTDADTISNYSYQDDFLTMEEFLTPEQYEKYEPYFYYIDLAAMEEWNTILDNPDNLFLDYSYDFPDPRKPEEMKQPVAVGIFMDDCTGLKDAYHFRSEDVVFAIFGNSTHLELAQQYLDYLMQ